MKPLKIGLALVLGLGATQAFGLPIAADTATTTPTALLKQGGHALAMNDILSGDAGYDPVSTTSYARYSIATVDFDDFGSADAGIYLASPSGMSGNGQEATTYFEFLVGGGSNNPFSTTHYVSYALAYFDPNAQEVASVPEPGTFALLATGLLLLIGRRRRA